MLSQYDGNVDHGNQTFICECGAYLNEYATIGTQDSGIAYLDCPSCGKGFIQPYLEVSVMN